MPLLYDRKQRVTKQANKGFWDAKLELAQIYRSEQQFDQAAKLYAGIVEHSTTECVRGFETKLLTR